MNERRYRATMRPLHPDVKPAGLVLVEEQLRDLTSAMNYGSGWFPYHEPNWKHRVAGNTIREQREKIHELQGFFKQCGNRYGDVFAACGMEVPAVFTPERHEDLLSRIEEMKALLGDMLPAVVGWAAKFNELGGGPMTDTQAYPMATAKQLADRYNALGIEVPDEVEH